MHASLWVDAFSSAAYIINRVPSPILGSKSPFEMLYLSSPNYDNFRIFGCRVYPYLRDYAPHKLAPRSIPCIFIGFSTQYKGYRCLDPSTGRVYITRHAQFDEVSFPFAGASSSSDLATLVFSTYDEPALPMPPATLPSTAKLPDLSAHPSNADCSLCNEPSAVTSITPAAATPSPSAPAAPTGPPPPAATSSIHPMTTRAKAGIVKPRHIVDLTHLSLPRLHHVLLNTTEPKGYKTALKDPSWTAAMHDELQAFHFNHFIG